MAEELHLPFRLLSTAGIPVLADYGLVHEGGGPDGETIAVPAVLLLRPDGTVFWKHVARRIPDRADPARILEAVERLAGPAPPPAPRDG